MFLCIGIGIGICIGIGIGRYRCRYRYSNRYRYRYRYRYGYRYWYRYRNRYRYWYRYRYGYRYRYTGIGTGIRIGIGKGIGIMDGEGDNINNKVRALSHKCMLFHWFFKLFEWVRGGGARQKTKKNNSFGDGLREPKPSFSFVFSMFPWPGGPWGIKKHCFFIGFSRFWSGGEARQKTKKIIVSATA